MRVLVYKENYLNKYISNHDIFCWSIAILVSFLSLSFVVIIGYFWDKAYQKGYEDGSRELK